MAKAAVNVVIKVLLISCCILLFFISCSSKSETNDSILVEQEIVFHDHLQLFNEQVYNRPFGGISSPQKMLVYIDSLICGPCFLNRISNWTKMIDFAEEYSESTSLIMIVAPKNEDSLDVRDFLSSNPLDYPLFMDNNGSFQRQNNLPRGLFVCLLDSTNKVSLMGSPISNETLWEQYKDSIKTNHNKHLNR